MTAGDQSPPGRKGGGLTGLSGITRLSDMAIPGSGKLGPGLDVLIVDDASDNAEMLAELVTACGHEVRIAHHGSTALEMLENKLADMIFLDVSLPDMDGYEVATTIRIRFGNRCWIVAMTGFSGNGERDNAHLAGCDAFVVKPFGFPEIKELLEAGTTTASHNPDGQVSATDTRDTGAKRSMAQREKTAPPQARPPHLSPVADRGSGPEPGPGPKPRPESESEGNK